MGNETSKQIILLQKSNRFGVHLDYVRSLYTLIQLKNLYNIKRME